MNPSPISPRSSALLKTVGLASAALLLSFTSSRADTASVVAAANTLLTAATAQTSPYALTTPVSLAYTLANDKKWTNLPGTPPDSNRNGPVIGGGPVSFNAYELSATVSSGQTVSPRAAALTLAQAAFSTAGYTMMDEIRNADDVIRSTQGSSAPWQYGDYHIAVLGPSTTGTSTAVSTTAPWMLQISGHHLAYNTTYNAPYVSGTPLFIGTEPPNYFSVGTDLTATEKAVIVGTDIVSSTTYPNDFLVSFPFTTSPTTTYYRTAVAAASITGGTAISGATSASYAIAATTASDNGFYYCVVTNASGSTSSNTVALTVTLEANTSLYNSTASTGTSPSPVITTQPTSQTIVTGGSATFTLAATNATSYQWYKIAATYRAPMEAQRAAVSALGKNLQSDNTGAKLGTTTFSDVIAGVSMSGDGNFPFTSTTVYPTGTTGRGVLYSSLTTAEKAQVKTMIEAWVNLQASDIAASLLADYESDLALNATYVGYQVGSGIADTGTATRANFDSTVNQEKTPLNSQNSYLRIDGPRCWIEFVVQAAVAYKSNGFVHYHSIWRDKLADYGNEFGGYLDTTSTSTTYTRPSITTQPASVTGSSATFTVVAAPGNTNNATSTVAYQWYNSAGTALSGNGATTASYTTTTAGSYYVKVSTAYGTVTSNTVTFTAAVAPSVATQPTSQTVVLGTSVTFSVTASGTGTLSYQWYFGGTAIPGATGSSYTISNTVAANAGNYYVVVTNSVGSTTSSTVTLTLTQPFAAYLSGYGLTGVDPTTDSDGDGISNLLEFVLGGSPVVGNTSILPTVSCTTSGSTTSLVYTFSSVTNLGNVTWAVEYSSDLATWATAVAGTGGVTITTSVYNANYNLNVVTIPTTTGSKVFTRLRATMPSSFTNSAATSTKTTASGQARSAGRKTR